MRCQVMVIASVVLFGAVVSSEAQTEVPMTPWGAPDLMGVWDYRTITPMQRPEQYGDREFLTEEEAADLDQAAIDREERLWNQASELTEA